VFACVNLLARTVATLPLKIYKRQGRGIDEAKAHALYDLIKYEPNPEMSSTSWRMAMESCRSLYNNAYSEVTWGTDGRPSGIWPIHPSDVEMGRTNGTIYYRVKAKVDEEGKEIKPERILMGNEMLHLRGLSFTGLAGVSSLDVWRDTIGLAQALDTNAAKFFGNGSRLGLILSHPGKLGVEARDFLKAQIKDQYEGVDNAFRSMVLQEGMKVESPRSANNESQMDESRQRQAKEICAIFGVPPNKVGILDNIPRANVEEANRDFAINTLRPIVEGWEAEMNRSLLLKRERRNYFIEFDLKGLERGSLKDRSAFYASARQWGYLSANEIRGLENLNPIDGGDEYLSPINMTAVGEDAELEQSELIPENMFQR
jgi:HK97 family phage portal protein